MANTPSSIEMQIDHFLEHFKRNASKAMDPNSVSSDSPANYANIMTPTASTAASFNQSIPLKTTKTRSSCFDISAISGM